MAFPRRYEEEGSGERREVPAEYTEVPLGVGDLLVIDPMLMHSASTNAGEVSAPLSPSDFLISPKEAPSSLASRDPARLALRLSGSADDASACDAFALAGAAVAARAVPNDVR